VKSVHFTGWSPVKFYVKIRKCRLREQCALDSLVDCGAVYIICFPTYPLSSLFSLLYLLPYRSFRLTIYPLCFQVGDHKRRPNLGFFVSCFCLFYVIVFLCFWCMIICVRQISTRPTVMTLTLAAVWMSASGQTRFYWRKDDDFNHAVNILNNIVRLLQQTKV